MKSITDLRDCYGKLFPDFTRLKRGEQQDGQAFSAVITGTGTGGSENRPGWRQNQQTR
jgi:hypothetical protein